MCPVRNRLKRVSLVIIEAQLDYIRVDYPLSGTVSFELLG